jgi:hypothetical protein
MSGDSMIANKQKSLCNKIFKIRVRVVVFNATFSKVSVISWWSVLLVGE